ncbi:acid sphingomyelinase-like phosphodiesterase 3b [Anabrus simplex]|uniref:acid sphingomyelinase-like phosphodiesterase 3b n=1 Tax=Anabrus simplex TaxID=316456 RepID=UPI0035A2B037
MEADSGGTLVLSGSKLRVERKIVIPMDEESITDSPSNMRQMQGSQSTETDSQRRNMEVSDRPNTEQLNKQPEVAKAHNSFSQTGYYSRVHAPYKLRIIVLNTIFFLESHIASQQLDPGDQWTWLEYQLINARKQDQKVYLVMSTPPGVFENAYRVPGVHWFHPRHNRVYINMVRKYKDVIRGQFGGHHHSDAFRIFFSKHERPVSWLFLAPSVGPRNTELAPDVTTYNNPAMRLYMYDRDTLEVLDYVQFYLNLTSANIRQNAEWKNAYTFTTFYNVPNISLYSFTLLMSRLNDNEQLFARYYEANSMYVHKEKECDHLCARYHACALQNMDYSSFFECISAKHVTSSSYKWRGTPLKSSAASLHLEL